MIKKNCEMIHEAEWIVPMSNSKEPLISVITTVYNTEKYLEMMLDSIVNQSYKNLEVVIVNNGSNGNVNVIFEGYKSIYPNINWIFVNIEKNVGLFHARGRGFEASSGEYIIMMDSDDRISRDFIYQLLVKAQATGADIVITDYVNEFEDIGQKHYALNPMELTDIEWLGEEALKNFFQFRGSCFNLHAIWNKLYSRELWIKSWEDISQVTTPLVLSEDILYSAILYWHSSKVVNIHGVYYYHLIYKTAESFNIADNSDKIMNGMRNQKDAFDNIKLFLERSGRYDFYKEDFEGYRCFLVSVLFNNVKASNLSLITKKIVYKKCKDILGINDVQFPQLPQYYFETLTSPFNDMKETVLEKIAKDNVKCIAFDIFDTLIERPFLRPDDTFEFLSMEYNNLIEAKFRVNFALIRKEAEKGVRDRLRIENSTYQEITLDEIYAYIVEEGVLDKLQAEKLKKVEYELEYRFCKERKIGKELYDFALRNNKKIICISDMYLPKFFIESILLKNGYNNISEIFVSSHERVCKYNGEIFRTVLRQLNLKAKEVLHLGDNYLSDWQAPEALGIGTAYISSASEMIKNRNGLTYSGSCFTSIFGQDEDPTAPQSFLGIRCMLGVIANRVFWNPFIKFEMSSQFDANPIYMGYFPLGMYIFSIAHWLMNQVRDKGYETIHFIARDGYLIKQAYDIMTKSSITTFPRSNYLYTSRKATMPLLISSREDLMAIADMIDIRAYSALSFLAQIHELIPDEDYKNCENILERQGILSQKQFSDRKEWNSFVKVILENFYSDVKIEKYRSDMRKQFGKIFGSHDCTFDVGYSARTESAFSNLLGTTIDAYYMYCNEERAYLQADRLNISIKQFHTEPANMRTMMMTETFLSAVGPSCNRYDIKRGEITYELEGKPSFNYQTRLMIEIMQNAAVDFVKDFIGTFPHEWNYLHFKYEDAAAPFKNLLLSSADFDRKIFSIANFGDSLTSYQSETLYHEWSELCQPSSACSVGLKSNLGYIEFAPLWKKIIYYVLFDLRTLKEKIRKKCHKHPILLKVMKFGYSIPRGIYHIFIRK